MSSFDPDSEKLLALEASAFNELNLLCNEIQQAHQLSRPNSSALLHHFWYAQSILRKIRSVVIRFCEQLAVANDHWKASEQLRLSGHTGFSQPLTDHGKVTGYLIIDFELMYQLAGIFLDQWSRIVRHLAGIGDGKAPNFRKFVTQMSKQHSQSSLVQLLHKQFMRELSWLHSNVLIVRDDYIVHYESPWQKSSLHYANDMSLGISLAPDWAGTVKVAEFELRITELAAKTNVGPTAQFSLESLNRYSANPRYIFSHMMWQFDKFSEPEQNELRDIARGFGFTTPPFKLLAERFFWFIQETMVIIREYANKNMSQIKLGLGDGDKYPFVAPTVPPG